MGGHVVNEENKLPPAKGKWKKWRSIGVCLVFLVLGAIIGSGATMAFFKSAFRRSIAMSPRDIADKTTSRIAKSLDLDGGQRDKVHAITLTHVEELFRIRDEIKPRVGREFRECYREISEILTDKQQERWQKHPGRDFVRRMLGDTWTEQEPAE